MGKRGGGEWPQEILNQDGEVNEKNGWQKNQTHLDAAFVDHAKSPFTQRLVVRAVDAVRGDFPVAGHDRDLILGGKGEVKCGMYETTWRKVKGRESWCERESIDVE